MLYSGDVEPEAPTIAIERGLKRFLNASIDGNLGFFIGSAICFMVIGSYGDITCLSFFPFELENFAI